MTYQARNWEEIRWLLLEVQTRLKADKGDQNATAVPVGPLVGNLNWSNKLFNEFLEHNELELAWDILAEMVERCKGPGECWYILARAAGLMQLTEKRDMAQQQATSPITGEPL